MNIEEAAALLSMISVTMPALQEKDLKVVARAWAIFMSDIPYVSASEAIIRIMRRRKISTLPLPGEIIEEVRAGERTPDDPPSAIEAWEEVRKCINMYADVKWSHPAIREAIQYIGTYEIIRGEYDIAQRFMRVYETVIQRKRKEDEIQFSKFLSTKLKSLGIEPEPKIEG